MKINENADLTILLEHGWESFNGGQQGCYYKIIQGDGFAEISLVINPVGVNLDFVINSLVYDLDEECDDSSIDMFEILQEIELLKKLNILISSEAQND